MNSITSLEQYLAALTTRIKRLRVNTAAAALSAALLLLTVVGVFLAMRQGFGSFIINTMRALIVLTIVTLVLWLLVWPLRRLKQHNTRELEQRTPAFAGRLQAFTEARAHNNPLTELLAEDTLKVAASHSVEQVIKPRSLQLPLIVAVASVLTLLWLAVSGPGLWSYGTRYLWAGWAVPTLKPAQSIAVTPGDQAVRRGGNVPVLAQMQGFAPGTADVYVQMGDDQWQQVAMTRTDQGFAFTFFSVREALKYYVAAGGVRSPDYQIHVIDLPNINNLKLTYNFPKWTGRKPEVMEPGGDVAALKDTRIEVEVTADAPLPETQLVLDDATQTMSIEGARASSDFSVQKQGRYYLAAKVAGESVRLSDDYFIRVVDDAKPEIKVVRPGRDYGASSIEEVTAHIDASDDYGLNEVTLHYAVNGAKWQSITLPANKTSISDDYVLSLESLGDKGAALKPGDLISYYAEAKDHSSTVRTDMFFVDVRPFDKRYSQSQQAGGAQGQGQGQQNQQGEISERQREIIVSTWNLIREQEEKSADKDKIEDNSKLLSELQTKLAAQASSLTQRMQARELDSTDAQAKEFAEDVKQAVEAMTPAAKALNQVELSDAIGPEQQALQYILRAEAVYNEIQVQQQQQGQGQGQGAGQQDSRDMAQIYELEMDLNKNQYESRNNASPAEQNQNQDDIEDKLKELARRQQQLADAARNQQQLTQEQRWQQESLKREAEQLQRQLQSAQQQASNQQNGQQSGQSGQQSGQAGGQASNQQSNQANNAQTQELQQRLQSAIRAMDESANAMRNTSDATERARAQRAASEAQRQLSGASDAVVRGQQQSQQSALLNLADKASKLYDEQTQFDRRLQDTIKQLRAQTLSDTDADNNGVTPQEKQLANDKRALSTELQALQRDMIAAQRTLKDQAPQTVAQIGDAAKELDDQKVDQRMSIAAAYLERGQAPFVVASESLVTDTLRNVRDDLRQAATQGAGSAANNDKASDAVAQVRALRQQLEQLNNQQRAAQGSNQANSNQAGNSQTGNGAASSAGGMGQGAQANAQANTQNGGQQGGQAQGNGQGSVQANGQNNGQNNGQANGQRMNGQGGIATGNGWLSLNGTGAEAVGVPVNLNRNISQTIQDARAAINELNQRGRLNQQDAQQLQDITRQLEALRAGAAGIGVRKGAEPTALALMEQLELKLSQASERKNSSKQSVRSAVAEPVPSDYEDAVAEYYRRLSKE